MGGYKPFDKSKSHYLLVGVGQRAVDSDAMAVSANDALYLEQALLEFNLFDKSVFEPLVNEKATRSDILKRLDDLIEKTKNEPADMVILFFSGHGYEKNDQYYLVCRDTQNNDIKNTSIEGSDFLKKLTSIQCDKMLVLLDCCHAEGMTDVPFDSDTFLSLNNRVILTSCHKTQLSYLSKPVSLFTYAVIEGLGGKFLKDGDKEVSLFNLSMDVRERVVALSKKIKKVQQPQLNALPESGTADFTLARYPKGGPQEVALLKKKLATLMSNDGKEILQTDIPSEQDLKEREKFNWMITQNTIINKGDGNWIVQGSTINNGLSENALKDILNHLEAKDKIIENLVAELQKKADPESKSLLIKVRKVKVTNQVVDIVDQGRKNIIKTLIEKRMLILEEIEKDSGNTLIALKMSLAENTKKLKAYGIELDELGLPDLKSIELE